MKAITFALGALLLATAAQAAQFEFVSLEKLKSADLATFGKASVELQNRSEAVVTYAEDRLLDSRVVKIKSSRGQSELKMIRQLLHVDFNCTTEAVVSAVRSDRKEIMNFPKAFVSDMVDESTDYLREVDALEATLLKALKANRNLEVYDVEYSGGGECEFGKDGFILLDKKRSEALFLYSQWSA